jgi:hypothetical protein
LTPLIPSSQKYDQTVATRESKNHLSYVGNTVDAVEPLDRRLRSRHPSFETRSWSVLQQARAVLELDGDILSITSINIYAVLDLAVANMFGMVSGCWYNPVLLCSTILRYRTKRFVDRLFLV